MSHVSVAQVSQMCYMQNFQSYDNISTTQLFNDFSLQWKKNLFDRKYIGNIGIEDLFKELMGEKI